MVTDNGDLVGHLVLVGAGRTVEYRRIQDLGVILGNLEELKDNGGRNKSPESKKSFY